MKLLVIDNYDSFTYNLVQLFGEMDDVDVVVKRNDEIWIDQIKKLKPEQRAQYEQAAGEAPEATLKRFRDEPPAQAAAWLKTKPGIGKILDWDADGNGPALIPISCIACSAVSRSGENSSVMAAIGIFGFI